jgi:hypothetical protein
LGFAPVGHSLGRHGLPPAACSNRNARRPTTASADEKADVDLFLGVRLPR